MNIANTTNYVRQVETAVLNFFYCQDQYLFLKRSLDKPVDPGKLNAPGGRVEIGENFVTAIVRESYEETGITVTPSQLEFCGLARIIFDGDHDWEVAFFKTKVTTKEIPLGNVTADGELLWLSEQDLLKRKSELVDDLNYLLPHIIRNSHIFFFSANSSSNQIKSHTLQLIDK